MSPRIYNFTFRYNLTCVLHILSNLSSILKDTFVARVAVAWDIMSCDFVDWQQWFREPRRHQKIEKLPPKYWYLLPNHTASHHKGVNISAHRCDNRKFRVCYKLRLILVLGGSQNMKISVSGETPPGCVTRGKRESYWEFKLWQTLLLLVPKQIL